MGALTIGYAAMLEQFAPADAVALSAYAETAGFSGVMATDHFQPWVPQQGQSSFVWNVLTAIAEKLSGRGRGLAGMQLGLTPTSKF